MKVHLFKNNGNFYEEHYLLMLVISAVICKNEGEKISLVASEKDLQFLKDMKIDLLYDCTYINTFEVIKDDVINPRIEIEKKVKIHDSSSYSSNIEYRIQDFYTLLYLLYEIKIEIIDDILFSIMTYTAQKTAELEKSDIYKLRTFLLYSLASE